MLAHHSGTHPSPCQGGTGQASVASDCLGAVSLTNTAGIVSVSPGHCEVSCSALSHSPHHDGLKLSGTVSPSSVVFVRHFSTATASLATAVVAGELQIEK